MFMVDYRCPQCNRPVRGKHEVVHLKRLPKVDKCPHCSLPIVLYEHDEGRLGKCYSFSWIHGDIQWSDEYEPTGVGLKKPETP